jgi:hypothetical protein
MFLSPAMLSPDIIAAGDNYPQDLSPEVLGAPRCPITTYFETCFHLVWLCMDFCYNSVWWYGAIRSLPNHTLI